MEFHEDDEDWEEERECDDWKGEDMTMYENIDDLIDSIGPYELRQWRNLFRHFLAKNKLKHEACEITDRIHIVKLKGNSFIYVNDDLLDLCVLALVRKIYAEDRGYFYLPDDYDDDYVMEKLERFFRLGAEVQSSKSFRVLCCELNRWVESGYRTKFRNPKLASAILNQLKNK